MLLPWQKTTLALARAAQYSISAFRTVGQLLERMISLASPFLRAFRVDLYPSTYFPLFITSESLLLMFSVPVFFTIYGHQIITIYLLFIPLIITEKIQSIQTVRPSPIVPRFHLLPRHEIRIPLHMLLSRVFRRSYLLFSQLLSPLEFQFYVAQVLLFYLLGQAIHDPGVEQCVQWLQALGGVVDEDFLQELHQGLILNLDIQRLGIGNYGFALLRFNYLGRHLVLEILVHMFAGLNQPQITVKQSLQGAPMLCMMRLSCSCSFLPANKGQPRQSQAMRQPKLHMSMAQLQGAPRMTSGARQNLDWMYMKETQCSSMLVPKSMSLMPVLDLFLRSTFSGLISEWMILFSLRKTRALRIWMAKVRIWGISMDWNWFSSIRSYRLILSSQVTMQICLRNTIKSFILTMFFSLSMSFSFALIRMLISFNASCMCYFFDFIIFIATTSLFLWSNAFTTSPNAPLPRHSISQYRYPTCSCFLHKQDPSPSSSPGPAPTPMQYTVFSLINYIFWFSDRIGANLCSTFLPDNPGREPRKVYQSRKFELLTIFSFFFGTFITSEIFFFTWLLLRCGVWDCYLVPLLLLLFLEVDCFLFYWGCISRLNQRWVRMGSRQCYLGQSNSRKEWSSGCSGDFYLCLNSVFSRKNGFLFFSHRQLGLLRFESNLSFILIYIINYLTHIHTPSIYQLYYCLSSHFTHALLGTPLLTRPNYNLKHIMKGIVVVFCVLIVAAQGFSLFGEYQRFKDYAREYGKHYSSQAIQIFRFGVYLTNLVEIERLNLEEQGTAVYGLTKFTDMTKSEMKQHLGLKIPSNYTIRYSANFTNDPHYKPRVDLPDIWNWQQQGAVAPVKDQGSCGSCWTFSVAGNVQGQWWMKKKELVQFSMQQLVDCDKSNFGCSGGWPYMAIDWLSKHGGIQTYHDYPLRTNYSGPCQFNETKAAAKIKGYLNITHDEAIIKDALYEKGPLSILLDFTGLMHYKSGIADPRWCSTWPDHALVLVGYGTKDGDYWLIKNSWGPKWGINGYFMLKRGAKKCGISQWATTAILDQ